MENNEVKEPTKEEILAGKKNLLAVAEMDLRKLIIRLNQLSGELTNRGIKRAMTAALSYEALDDVRFKFQKRTEAEFAGLLGQAIQKKQTLMLVKYSIEETTKGEEENGKTGE